LEGYIQTESTPVDVLPLQEVVQNILIPSMKAERRLPQKK